MIIAWKIIQPSVRLFKTLKNCLLGALALILINILAGILLISNCVKT